MARRASRVLRDCVAITKPRVIVLLEVTTLGAMVVAAHGWPGWTRTVCTLGGGWLGASGANAINCWFDRDIDARMSRTRRRPIPAGRLHPWAALLLGTGLGAASFAVLALSVNLLAAALTLAGLLFYVLVYTMWLKRASTQNIVIGGAAGAVPPLVGWAAVQGRIGLTALLLFAVVFVWTPPHFWALSLLVRGDYQRAGVPMLPVIVGEARTRRQILLYTVLLCAVTTLPLVTRAFGSVYAAGAAVLDAILLWDAGALAREGSSRAARRLFMHSMIYLAALFALMALDRALAR